MARRGRPERGGRPTDGLEALDMSAAAWLICPIAYHGESDDDFHASQDRASIMIRFSRLFIPILLLIISIHPSSAQWNPSGKLIDVPVRHDCTVTGGEITAVNSDGLFHCPSRANLIDSQIADASHFYLVQAYGQVAIHTKSQKLADCWAAHQLASAPRGRYYIGQWIRYWRTYGTRSAAYGRPEERIANVRSCCACGV
jgi:hypothetical protein